MGKKQTIPALAEPFEPCAVFYPEGNYTELLVEEAPIVWRALPREELIDMGFDMKTGKLIAVRISGRHEKRK